LKITFNRPGLTGRELDYVTEAIRSGHASGDGGFTFKCQKLIEEALGAPKVLLTTSCTDALEMTALLLHLQPGDEVIVPSFAFVSTVNAYVLRGARPVFVDVRPDTLNLDETKLEPLITPRTRAIIVLHYAGVACEMDPILEIGARHKAPVIEDNAHGLFARYKGRPLGALGCLATQSFHETKNFHCGEGGALVINDPGYIDRAEIIREKGTNRSRFFRGQVDKYTWVDLGSSYLPSEIQAAFLLAQIEKRAEIMVRRASIFLRYQALLADWARSYGVLLPTVPEGCEPGFHVFYLILPSLPARQALISHLNARDITAVFHYQPLHSSPMGRRFGGRPGDCPVTESISDRLLRLPLFYDLSDDELERVVTAVLEFRPDGGA
jgi:dTDP-4-amino-4,6-dideoxygalactose transaminase